MKGKKLIIVLVVVAVILSIVVFKFTKKAAVKKMELNTYGGLTKEEFKMKLQNAWKDHYYEIVKKALMLPEEWAKEWRSSIDDAVIAKDLDFDQAITEAAHYSYAKDNPKASDNVWSTGWLSEIYVRGELGLDPNDKAIREVILSI